MVEACFPLVLGEGSEPCSNAVFPTARYILLGELESLMKSISSALATQYPETLGEFTFEDIRSENLYQSWRCALSPVKTRKSSRDGLLFAIYYLHPSCPGKV